MLAGAAVSAGGSAVSTVASQIIIRLLSGTFNPAYRKEDRRKMRYIQRKYCLAYQSTASTDESTAIISSIDPNSKLLMSPDGTRPANPFQDEPQFEESLQMNFHPVSGHQGRFVASHAMACIGVINDYQIQRRGRMWVPGVQSPGHPNDYINMFLEETKAWMRAQMTLDVVQAEELARRDNFYTKLKNDNYFWCFPPESESRSIHKVIDFVHDKVKNALELISREEKNKSLQTFFKELNDHSTNAFEFGKQFLAFLLCPSKKIGGNLTANSVFDGRTYETGKLHNLLESATNVVLESYVEDMTLTQQRLDSSRPAAAGEGQQNRPISGSNGGRTAEGVEGGMQMALYRSNTTDAGAEPKVPSSSSGAISSAPADAGWYLVEITDFEESTLRPVVYIVELIDPKGHRWVVRKTFADFVALHALVTEQNRQTHAQLTETLILPEKLPGRVFRDKEEYYSMGKHLQAYLVSLLYVVNNFTSATQAALATFLEVKQLILSPNSRQLRRAETIPNAFVALKREFNALLLVKDESKGAGDKAASAMMEFRRIWGIEMTAKVFDAYALLQRMATVLGWTLEINHFFISMFGNTLAFSKLPLRDIIFLQRDIMTSFLAHCTELFDFACKVNADSKYKWHKNLQMVENHLGRTKFHIDKALSLISLIDSEHLDYNVQMRRLRDVHARFQPLMNRIDGSLENIQEELSLPVTHRASVAAPDGTSTTDRSSQAKQPAGPHNNSNVPAIENGVYESGASSEQRQLYTVEEPQSETPATPAGIDGGRRIFSRDQSPDIPTQAANPLQSFEPPGGKRTAEGAAERRPPGASGRPVSSTTGGAVASTGARDLDAIDAEGEEPDANEGEGGSKVCVIS